MKEARGGEDPAALRHQRPADSLLSSRVSWRGESVRDGFYGSSFYVHGWSYDEHVEDHRSRRGFPAIQVGSEYIGEMSESSNRIGGVVAW